MLYFILKYLRLNVLILHLQGKDCKVRRKKRVRLFLFNLQLRESLLAYTQQNYQLDITRCIGIFHKFLLFLHFPWGPEFRNTAVNV